MMTASEDESELLHRFSTRHKDQETARVLVERLKGWLLLRLRQQWPWLLSNYEDIEAGALLRLVRMRNDGELEDYETLERLARS